MPLPTTRRVIMGAPSTSTRWMDESSRFAISAMRRPVQGSKRVAVRSGSSIFAAASRYSTTSSGLSASGRGVTPLGRSGLVSVTTGTPRPVSQRM